MLDVEGERQQSPMRTYHSPGIMGPIFGGTQASFQFLESIYHTCSPKQTSCRIDCRHLNRHLGPSEPSSSSSGPHRGESWRGSCCPLALASLLPFLGD